MGFELWIPVWIPMAYIWLNLKNSINTVFLPFSHCYLYSNCYFSVVNLA